MIRALRRLGGHHDPGNGGDDDDDSDDEDDEDDNAAHDHEEDFEYENEVDDQNDPFNPDLFRPDLVSQIGVNFFFNFPSFFRSD